MKAKIKRFDKSVELPRYHSEEAAAFDLAASRDVVVEPGEIKLIPTGLVIESPAGYFLLVAMRSSTPKKKGLMKAQSVGIVDRDYAGPDDEIFIQVYNFTDETVEVKKGERIAQGMFLPIEQVVWEEVDEVRSGSRGGFGSTG